MASKGRRIFLFMFIHGCFLMPATAQQAIIPACELQLQRPKVQSLRQIILQEDSRLWKNTFASPGFYAASPQGFFCKAEFRLEQRTGIPIRFRLGSLDYTEALENK